MNAMVLAVYGLGHLGKTAMWLASVLTFPYFLTEVVGLRPSLMGQILALSLVFNAICDFAVGKWLTTRVATLREAGTVHAVGAVAAASAFIAFAQTAEIEPELRTHYSIVTLLFFRLGYSLFDVPQNTMLALAQGNDVQRSQIAAVRYGAGGAATLAIGAFLAVWLPMADTTSRSSAYIGLAVTLSILAVATATLTAIALRPLQASASQSNFPTDTLYAVRPILISIALYSGIMSIFVKLQPYFFAIVGAGFPQALNFVAFAALGQIAAQPVWALLARQMALSRLYLTASMTLSIVGVAFLIFARNTGTGVIVVAVVFGAASSGTLMAIWSLMASVAAAPNASPTALFGRFTFISKSAQALGALAVGFILDGSTYKTPQAAIIISAWMGTAVVIAGIACTVASRFARKGHAMMRWTKPV